MPRTISELILRHRQRTDESYDRMAARGSAGDDAKVHSSYLQRVAKGGAKEMPKYASTFRAIAVILGMPEQTVLLAFAAELGLDVRGPRFGDRIPPEVDHLPDDVLDNVNRLLRSMVQHRGSTEHDPSYGVRTVTEGEIASGQVRSTPRDSRTRSTTEGTDTKRG